jgi:hypothetical protein
MRFSLAGVALLLGCQEADPPIGPIDQANSLGAAVTPGLAAPSNGSAIASSETQVDFSWRDNSTTETGYEVYRSPTGAPGTFARIVTTGANVVSYSNQGLEPLTQYCYQVRAVKVSRAFTKYTAFSNSACATTPPPPPAPVSVTWITLVDSTSVRLGWLDPTPYEDGFRLYRSIDGGVVWGVAATVGVNQSSWAGADPLAEHPVCYRVVTFNVRGDAVPSSMACTTPPAQPSNLNVTELDSVTYQLEWNDNSAIEDGYDVGVTIWFTNCARGATICDTGLWGGESYLVAQLPANSTSYRTDSCGGAYIICDFGVSARKN